ncbi:MAG TPA: peroxidase family protein [Hyphomicrobiaceae bacterium]|nr:peroxidase family protein [Hyphomicrobiaceae bacterium]
MHGFNPLSLRAHRLVVDEKAMAKPDPRRGFRNLFGTPDVVFSAGGLMQEPDSEKKLTNLMIRLASRTAAGQNRFWSDRLVPPAESAAAAAAAAPLETWENPHLPSGYTYLLQLVAHDLVASTVSLSIDVERAQVENSREDALLLETVYGDGPEITPEPYEFSREALNGRGLVPRTRLRIGPQRPKIAGTTHCPHRDLGRGTGTAGVGSGNHPINVVEDGARDSDRAKLWLTETMVADTRNDSHALLSQLTVLFHILHNTLIEKLEKRVARKPEEWSEQEFAWRRFVCARAAVTLIYRRIIRNDLMRRLLHPDVYDAYTRGWRLEKAEEVGEGIPVEFSHGAFRFGHAMVRDEYRVNDPATPQLMDFGLQQSPRLPYKLPVNADWLVDWRLFFEVDPAVAPNFSRRIGPHYARPLLADLVFTPESGRGLPFLDHLSAAYAGLWSVPSLLAHIKEVLSEQRNSSLANIFITYDLWRAPFSGWLGEGDSLIPLSDDDKTRLATDPPLSLFVVFEAAHSVRDGVPERNGGGAHLGALGSLIVAETIYGALDRNRVMFDGAPSLGASLSNCCAHLLDAPGALADVAVEGNGTRRDINEMKDVILFLAANGAFPA